MVLTAANTTLGRNGVVAMGTVKGGNVHDERLPGRLGRLQKEVWHIPLMAGHQKEPIEGTMLVPPLLLQS